MNGLSPLEIALEEFILETISLDVFWEEFKSQQPPERIFGMIKQHKQSPKFRQVMEKITQLQDFFRKEANGLVRDRFFQTLARFGKETHQNWKQIYHTLPSHLQLSFQTELNVIFQTLFLSMGFMLRPLAKDFSALQSMMLLDMFGWLEFASVEFPVVDQVLSILVANIIWEKQDMCEEDKNQLYTQLLSILPRAVFEQTLTAPVLNQARRSSHDVFELSRAYFVLGIFQRFCHEFSDPLLRFDLLPVLVQGIQSTDEPLNKYCHALFSSLFSTLSEREVLVDFCFGYLSVCLSYEKTPFEQMEVALLAMVTNFPESHLPLLEQGLDHISDHIRQRFSSHHEPPFLFLLFKCINLVPHQLLPRTMSLVEGLIVNNPLWRNDRVLSRLNFIITTDFDFTRKTKCIYWFLNLRAALLQENHQSFE